MSVRTLGRLLRPASIAVVGGGAWCEAVIGCCRESGFDGPIWPVHPKRSSMGGLPVFRAVEDLPTAPDACFIGVNRNATIDVVQALSQRGAGGAVCFASGFREATDGRKLQDALIEAAGEMRLLGPNCYGFINALDGAALWPDVHGLKSVERGVAIIGQSSNVLLNLSMQRRGLPIAYLIAAGNQAQQGMADIGLDLLEDDRVTALGFHVEGFSDVRAFERLAAWARQKGKAIVVLKVGRSTAAQQATLTHTASLAGSDAGANALMARLGLVPAESLTQFLTILSLGHLHGRRRFERIASLSCSGGEASLIADTAAASGRSLSFPGLADDQKRELKKHLGAAVPLANPLDYHTGIWRDIDAMRGVFAAMAGPDTDMTCLVLDYPRGDRCDGANWDIALNALIQAKEQSGKAFALVASLPENLPEHVAERAFGVGIVPLTGFDDTFASLAATRHCVSGDVEPILLAGEGGVSAALSEAEAKAALAAFGLRVPRAARVATAEEAAACAKTIGLPIALKGEGAAHKSEAGLVRLGLATEREVLEAAEDMQTDAFLVEEMITDVIAELLIGAVRDPAHGFVLTFGAGGTLTELLDDSTSLLIPASRDRIAKVLASMKIARLLQGYRGRPAANVDNVLDAILAIQTYIVVNADSVIEVEINPLLITPDNAIAADALIVRTP